MDARFDTQRADDAYTAGRRAGWADTLLGIQSTYAWGCVFDPCPYAQAYGRGYRDGWNEGVAARRRQA